MRTAIVIMVATLTFTRGLPAAQGEKKDIPPKQETHRSAPPASRGWPEQWGERKLYRSEHAFVYAQEKSTADEIVRTLRTVLEDVKQDGVTQPARGLIVVIDAHEKVPVEIARLTEILNDPNTRAAEERSKEILNSIKEARKVSDQAGTDVNSLAFTLPIPLRPVALPKIAEGFPEGLDREIAWCLILPTDRYVRTGMRAVMDAIVKIDNMDWKERLLIGAATPLALYETEKRVRRIRQADLYQLLVEGQKDLSKKLKKEKVNAYRQKLGLGSQSEPEAGQEQTKATPMEEESQP